jgi:hypothetical protein
MDKFDMKSLLGDLIGDCESFYSIRSENDRDYTSRDLHIDESEWEANGLTEPTRSFSEREVEALLSSSKIAE